MSSNDTQHQHQEPPPEEEAATITETLDEKINRLEGLLVDVLLVKMASKPNASLCQSARHTIERYRERRARERGAEPVSWEVGSNAESGEDCLDNGNGFPNLPPSDFERSHAATAEPEGESEDFPSFD